MTNLEKWKAERIKEIEDRIKEIEDMTIDEAVRYMDEEPFAGGCRYCVKAPVGSCDVECIEGIKAYLESEEV